MIARLSTLLMATALVWATLGASGHAAGDKPALKIETKLIEASVTIDESLKAYPGLYDNLLAEGRRELAKWRADVDKDRELIRDIGRSGRRYAFERSYTQRSSIGRYVSVVRADYMDELGAHPNRLIDTILWDTNAKKRVSIRPLFKEIADGGAALQSLAKAVRAALAIEKRARDLPLADPETDESLSAVKPKMLEIGAVALAPSTEAGKSAGMLFYFSPYAVGPYAEGEYTVFVPWTAFEQSLSAEGAGLFGGERPPADAKKDE